MRPIRFFALTSLSYLLLLITPSVMAKKLLPGDPLLDEPCSICHAIVDNDGDVPLAGAEVLHDTQERLCAGCHMEMMMGSHPSGLIPSFSTPPEYPLDYTGKMTCSSCHIIHLRGHAPKRPPAAGFDDCTMCHKI